MCDTLIEPSQPAPHPHKRKLLPYLILAVLFVLGLTVYLCIPTAPQPITDPEQPWFSICDGVLNYDSTLYTGTEELTVPETVAGMTVTAIGEYCFAGDTRITTVNLPKTVTYIGARAFRGCKSLRGIFVPESVQRIGAEAFYGCISLESLCIPYSVKSVAHGAFANCPKLYHIFYAGPCAAWEALYNEPINTETRIYAADGVVRQKDIASLKSAS